MGARPPLALACVVAAGLGACQSHEGRAPTPAREPTRVEIPRAEAASSAAPPRAAPAPTLPAGDCRALRGARALAVAAVVLSEPDCSGVGHQRVVLEVRQLARGAGIERIVTSRPLGSADGPAFQKGDLFVVAVEPGVRPAEVVYCVALPAHQGSVRHALKVGSEDEARRILDEVAAGAPCAD